MSYKLILCDLDETLLDDQKNIPIQNKIAIQKARDKGVFFVCASGRHYAGMTNVLKKLDLFQKENEYILALNGALIVESKNYKPIYSSTFSGKIAYEIVKFGLEKNLCIELYTPNQMYIYNLNDSERKRVERSKLSFIELENEIDFLLNEQVLKIALESEDFDTLLSYKDKVNYFIGDEISLTYSSNRYMEFNSKNSSKGLGLIKLAEYLNISIDETMAIGDHFNDVSMLEVAGLSIAANNAQEDVKKICDYVTNANNNEGVVAEAIYKFILGGNENE